MEELEFNENGNVYEISELSVNDIDEETDDEKSSNGKKLK